jgi:CBS domain-containing protein
MINRGIRHVPVTSARGELVGVVTDVDLLASETRTPFMVRRAIARADTIDRLIEVAADLRPTAIALHDSKIASGQLAAIIAAFSDSLTRRAIELLTAEMDDLAPFAWLATGSIGRREAFPSSDIDCAIAWEGSPAYGERFRALAEQVLDVLARCRFASDSHSASAAHPLFARSTGGWRASISRWLDRADDPRLLIVISLLADRHTVHRTSAVDEPFEALSDAHRHPELIRELRRLALAHRPPTGFLRNMVLEHSGEHRGRLDIKQAGFLPIVDLARYLAFANAITATGTVERLNAASEAGAIGAEDALALIEAFDLFVGLRMGHQIEQLRRDQPISDFIDPAELNPLTRRYLREAFRAIARSQRKLPQFHER